MKEGRVAAARRPVRRADRRAGLNHVSFPRPGATGGRRRSRFDVWTRPAPETTILPSPVTATFSPVSVKLEEVDDHRATVGEVGVEVPSGSRRATAKLELRLPVAPAMTIRPSGCRASALRRCRGRIAGERGERRHGDVGRAAGPEPLVHRAVGIQTHHRQLGDARRADRSPAWCRPCRRAGGGRRPEPRRSAPTNPSSVTLPPLPNAGSGMTAGLIAGDVGVVIDADAVAAGVAAGAADDDEPVAAGRRRSGLRWSTRRRR